MAVAEPSCSTRTRWVVNALASCPDHLTGPDFFPLAEFPALLGQAAVVV
jgi:hypothetical protein